MSEQYKRLERKLIHEGSIIDLYQDVIEVANGNVVKWDFIAHKGAAAVVPVTNEGKILMVRQYRNALDCETLEIPAGGLDEPDEPTLFAARRELEEETGYKSDHIKFLISIRTAVAFCNEKIDIYVATNLVKTQQNLDEDEFIEVEEYTVDELVKMIFEGKIVDNKTISAIFAYKSKYSV
ncbi:MAG: NUDIX hydrolase [Eubacteriales bacterium]